MRQICTIAALLLAGCALPIPPGAGDPPCWVVGETRRMLDTYQSSVAELELEELTCAARFRFLEADELAFRDACGTCGPYGDCARPAYGCSFETEGHRVVVLHEMARDPEKTVRHEVLHNLFRCQGRNADAQHLEEAWAWVAERMQTNDSPGCVLVQEGS